MIETFMRISIPRSGVLKYSLWACITVVSVGLLWVTCDKLLGARRHAPIELKPRDYEYGVMLDAGSSGTRVYLYRWITEHTNGLLKIEQMKDKAGKILAMKTSPGLSAYADNPLAAYKSIKSLLLYASLNIPNGKHRQTPLYILCTAGMRLLPEEKANNIMNSVSTNIQQHFDFFFQHSHIEIIDGRMEGVYGWIAVNYMLGRFDHDFVDSQRPATVGALDMGGASTQITYEVPKSEEVPADLSMAIDLGCHAHPGQKSHTYHLYATSFLGMGANEARKSYVDLLISSYKPEGDTRRTLPDPCLPLGMQETLHHPHQLTLVGQGNFTACRRKVTPLLHVPTTCGRSPCSMNGVFQPPINFYNQEMYGFSEFWYTMDDILKLGGHYKEEKFAEAASQFCHTDWRVLEERFKKGDFPRADQHRFHYQCFKSAWVLAILHDGHRFPSNYKNFVSAKRVNNEVIQWTYGAMIYRTRYLKLRQEGVDKVMSVYVSKVDVIAYYAGIFCFVVVFGAVLYWCYKLRRLRRTTFLPTTLNDLHEFHSTNTHQLSTNTHQLSTNTHQLSTIYHYSYPNINFNNVCQPPAGRGAGLLPRSFSDILLNREQGGGKIPLVLGD